MKTEREKVLEKKLIRKMASLGGWSLKLLSTHISGLPDRLCLLPGGRMFFAEVKETNRKPRKIQIFVHNKLMTLGFRVDVIDSSEQIENIK